ncbi:hypothetical protein CTAYLR_007505 [Chrysophaeum taylorii]|uniref:HMA domain-containing protein n=1 Tax=Chrysophaeum taylorii TaxID=2483200 RepID=A0AAD7UK22_9STRA|nr:hypothetical protein CTAYLR_007505 [Chrysophaeum taylorii]
MILALFTSVHTTAFATGNLEILTRRPSSRAAKTKQRGTEIQKTARLIWSPRVTSRVVGNIVALALVGEVAKRWPPLGAARATVENAVLWSAHRLEMWSVLSLLASSCCLVQLVLNVFSVGCAGFNTYLGPTRPFFLALTIHAQYALWTMNSSAGGRIGRIVATALAATLSFLPEILAGIEMMRQRRDIDDDFTLTLRLPTMGCAACVDAVSRTVRSLPAVASARVEVGSVVVTGSADAQTIIRACEKAGFPNAEVVYSAGKSNDAT